MTERVQNMKAFILDRSYRQTRRNTQPDLRQALIGKSEWDICHLCEGYAGTRRTPDL